jgi:hypothetical protein
MHVRHAASFGATSAHRLEARAARIGGPLIPGSTKKGSHFVFNGALQDQACTQPTHLGQSLAIPGQSLSQELVDLCLEPGTRSYSVHLA